jgi:RHS repeat-associated protein
VTSDPSGQMVSLSQYKPWGESREGAGTSLTDYGFTGQRESVSIGLYFYNARWYDSYLNQWNQPDTIIPDPYNPLDWNRYSYVRNNPINFSDPTGHDVDCSFMDDACKAQVLKEKEIDIENNGPVIWDNLSNDDKKTLSKRGWTPDSWNKSDFGGAPELKDVGGTAEDPVVWIIALVSAGKISSSAISLIKELISSGVIICETEDCTSIVQQIEAKFPPNNSQLGHIFRKDAGHFTEDTAVNRSILLNAISPNNFIGIDQFGNQIFAQLLSDGTEIWVQIQGGIIQNGGINLIPRWVIK